MKQTTNRTRVFPFRASFLSLACVAIVAPLLLHVKPAAADTVTVNGIPTPGVEVLGVRDGRLVYLTPAGAEVQTSLDDVEAVQIDAHPGYAEAVALLAEEEFGEAADRLQRVMGNTGRDAGWVRRFASWRLVQALDAADRGAEAVAAYAALGATNPDPFFLGDPPTLSAGRLTGDGRRKAASVVERALRRAEGPAAEALNGLLATLNEPDPGNGAGRSNDPDPTTGDATGDDTDSGNTTTDDRITLPQALAASDDPAVALIQAGKFEDAIARLDADLRRDPGRVQQRLYLRAVAQLGIADRTQRRDHYLDAGLGFMRVAVLSRTGGTYLGPALLETAYVHQRIDEPEIADTLLDEAGLLIDEETEPRYYRRYRDLLSR